MPTTRRGGHPDRARRSPGPGSLGGEQVEGPRAVLAALEVGRREVRSVWIASGRATPMIEAVRAAAAGRGVSVRLVDVDQLERMARTDAAQGVVARADPVRPAPLDGLLANPSPFLVALDGVTDPRNLGAILRTAEGAGVTGAVVPRRRQALLTPAAVKAAAGAVEHLPIALVPGVPAALTRASRAGLWIVGLAQDSDLPLFGLELADRPILLVLGSEGRGLARLTRARCDVVVSIPMRGTLGSLNVSVAAALACYEVARARD